MTAGGGGDRLAVCNCSLSSSFSILPTRLNERSVMTVTARCTWQPAELLRMSTTRRTTCGLLFGISGEGSGGGGGEERIPFARLLSLEVLEVTVESSVNKTPARAASLFSILQINEAHSKTASRSPAFSHQPQLSAAPNANANQHPSTPAATAGAGELALAT